MPISFTCPTCQTAYKVKDDQAGKLVACKSCKSRIRVPAAPTNVAAAHEAEALAVAALADEGQPDGAVAETIEIACPQCMETVQFDAKFGGKQAPCPSCRRIVRVPMPQAAKAKNWRDSTTRPSLAKQEHDPALEGHWGNVTQTSVVSRDALVEADVIPPRRPGTPFRTKVIRGVIAVLVVALCGIGTLIYKNRRADVVRDDYVQRGLDLLKASGETVPPLAQAATHRSAAEYFLNLREPKPQEAQRHLGSALALVAKAPVGPDGGVERILLLTEIALQQADITGTPEQIKAEQRLPWKKVMTDLRKSFEPVKTIDPALHDGVVLMQERLTRRLGMRGEPNQPMIASLPGLMYSAQNEAEGQAVLGWELLALNESAKAKEQAAQAKTKMLAAGATTKKAQARLAALFIALGDQKAIPGVDPPAGGEPPIATRLAYTAAWARLGEFDRARELADAPGPFDHRFQAKVLLAAEAAEKDANAADIQAAVDFLEFELRNRDLPDWPTIHLGQLCARSSSGAAQKLVEFLNGLQQLSPRGQSIRAWVILEILRSPTAGVTLNEVAVKAIAPANTLGHILAWEALARRNAAQKLVSNPTPVIETWPVPARPVAFVGTALGLQDSGK